MEGRGQEGRPRPKLRMLEVFLVVSREHSQRQQERLASGDSLTGQEQESCSHPPTPRQLKQTKTSVSGHTPWDVTGVGPRAWGVSPL